MLFYHLGRHVLTNSAIMVVGASKPTSIADKDGYFSVKSQMLVSFSCLK
ncbi:putative dihydrolipoyllysine-residue acetyltransferase [Helianthus annuus]|nr:putative dihydrolipoyllysine-residue acetyltransferase [Helianthus annuus]